MLPPSGRVQWERHGPRAVKPLVPRGRALRVDRPLPTSLPRNDEPATSADNQQEHHMRPENDTIPNPPDPAPDAHLEADFDDRHDLEED